MNLLFDEWCIVHIYDEIWQYMLCFKHDSYDDLVWFCNGTHEIFHVIIWVWFEYFVRLMDDILLTYVMRCDNIRRVLKTWLCDDCWGLYNDDWIVLEDVNTCIFLLLMMMISVIHVCSVMMVMMIDCIEWCNVYMNMLSIDDDDDEMSIDDATHRMVMMKVCYIYVACIHKHGLNPIWWEDSARGRIPIVWNLCWQGRIWMMIDRSVDDFHWWCLVPHA